MDEYIVNVSRNETYALSKPYKKQMRMWASAFYVVRLAAHVSQGLRSQIRQAVGRI